MPADLAILVNQDDPAYDQYVERQARGFWPSTWRLLVVLAGSRFCEAVRTAFIRMGDEPYYGIIDDDYWPITPAWFDKMVEAAGSTKIAIANNRQNFPSPYTCRVMGGDLARAIGTIAPGKMRHNYSDDTWGSFAQDFKLLVPLEDVIVEHHHPIFSGTPLAGRDATYQRGSRDFDEDTKLYAEWRNSDERRQQVERVAALLGVTISTPDFSKVRLLLLTPIQNHTVDIVYHHSFTHTLSALAAKRISYRVQQQSGSSHIGKGREHLLWNGLKAMPDATHIAFIDDDMGWEPNLLIRLIGSDHDFAAIAGVKKTDEVSPCYNAITGTQILHPHTKFMKVRHVGFAFVVLKRSVVEKMCEAYPELEYNTDGHGREWALFFDLMWKRAGQELPERLSEDFSFCQRWQAIGGEIWLDPYASIIHAGRKEYKGAAGDLLTPVTEEANVQAAG
jgi:glycosyltransferase involved in cell wall biosynthesis